MQNICKLEKCVKIRIIKKIILNCINDRKNERMKEDLANSLLFLISPLIIMYV